MFKTRLITTAAIATALLLTLSTATFAKKKREAMFKVRIENVAAKDGLAAADGSKYQFALSPGFYAVTDEGTQFFKAGKKAATGIEPQAEDGDPTSLSQSVVQRGMSGHFGVFNSPVGASMPSPILSGNAFEFTVPATEGMKLNLIAMFGQSNDLFYAPSGPIALFDEKGEPLSGDITDKFQLWDAGTEVNQAPGIGADQAPRQKMKNSGAAENGVVHLVNDGFTYPNTKEVLRITITSVEDNTAKSKKKGGTGNTVSSR